MINRYIIGFVLFLCISPSLWADRLLPVEDFVKQAFPHGVPINVANQYTSADSAKLVGLLQQPANLAYHSNILETLGFIGDPSATSAVINYIQQGDGDITGEAFRAKSNAFLSLGYMVNKDGNPAALTYLIDSLDMAVWQQRDVQWQVAFLPASVARDLQLMRQAAVGLTLSGHPEAAQAMASKLSPRNNERGFSPASGDMLQEMLRANAEVNSGGLESYLSDSQ